MCDETTTAAEDVALERKGLSRRAFAATGAAAALIGYAQPAGARSTQLRETTTRINTPDGYADAFFVFPSRGTHPGVILWPDVAGLRDAMKALARRLASAGYAVLVPNQYYRSAVAPILSSFPEWRTPAGQARLRPMIARITPEATMRDATAFVAFIDRSRRVDSRRKIGTQGYCMGGPHAIRTAAAVPARVGAAASFHGGGIASDRPDSPHLLLPRTQASYLIAVARNDDERNSQEKETFRAAAQAAGRPVEVEVYPADHGWCVPDTPVYDQAQADRAWERLLALYKGL